jgi:hypothetical protein
MEPLRFSLMFLLVIFGAYSEYRADEYLRLSKPGGTKITTVQLSHDTNAVPGNFDIGSYHDGMLRKKARRSTNCCQIKTEQKNEWKKIQNQYAGIRKNSVD